MGEINSYLDEMANLRAYASGEMGVAHHNHGWRKALKGESNSSGSSKRSPAKKSDAELRADWLRRLMSNGMSPLEHKWLVRILQKKVSVFRQEYWLIAHPLHP